MKKQIFIPNEFQSEASKRIEESILEGENAALVVMPTGTGKTYLAAQWFGSQLVKNPKARLLYVCHSQDILSQANDKEFETCLSEFDVPRGYYNKSEKNIGQVTFATVQTLGRNLNKLPSNYFDYIIVDEAHHYRANGFEKTIKHFSPKFLLGLTATPNRMDGRPLSDVFGRTIYSASISSGIKNGLLSKIKYYCVDNDIDFSEIKTNNRGNYSEKDLNKKICVKEYDDAIIREYTKIVKQEHNKKKTVCFCATVEHVYRMEKLFNDNGIKATALTGKRRAETGKDVTVHDGRRKQIISMFKDGDYDIIFVRDLFNEGMDIPDADCIMMLRPTESSRIFTQQIGRGLRVWKGKDYLLALDFTGNCHRCDINYDVLSDILEFDIEKDVRDRIRNNDISEIIIQNIGCEVRLSRKKIDVIRISEERMLPTDENLIKNYLNLKSKYPNLTSKMVNKKNGSQFGESAYCARFGSWNKFLETIGEKINHRVTTTDEELIKNYWELKNKYPGLTSKMVNIKNGSKFDGSAYTRHFGSWNKFLEAIGEKIEYRMVSATEIADEDLIKNYWDLKNKYPNLTSTMVNRNNGSKFDLSNYVRRFGNWNKFLETIGEIVKNSKKITDEDLIKNYWELKNKYPNLKFNMVNRKNGSKFGESVYINRFGSWNKFLEIIGEKYRKKITDEDLIKNYWELKNKYPDLKFGMINRENGSKFGATTYIRHFGSWNKFLEAIGEKVEYKNVITDEELIKNYWELKNKCPDLTSDMVNRENGSKFDITTYLRHFGSWCKFLETIGEKCKISKEDLIENYWELKNKYPNLSLDMVTKNNGSKFHKINYIRLFGSWNKFLETIGEKCRENITKEDLIKNYWKLKNKYPNLTSTMIHKKNGSQFSIGTYLRLFGKWNEFLEVANQQSNMNKYKKDICRKNITIVQDYTPKNPLSGQIFEKSGKKSRINARSLSGYRYGGSDDKDNIRRNIIEKIKDGDIVLMLESPELGALKEIEKQGKNPKKIIIPNHLEFDDVAEALKGYNTNLNIELINTSALQYIVDHPEEHLNFLWLDYCGAFSYYVRDLETVFQREIKDMKLILTYNVFDPKKQDDSYYFTNVIGYVLKKLCGKNEILLMEDISQRYKKTMFSVGFDIKKSIQL